MKLNFGVKTIMINKHPLHNYNLTFIILSVAVNCCKINNLVICITAE